MISITSFYAKKIALISPLIDLQAKMHWKCHYNTNEPPSASFG